MYVCMYVCMCVCMSVCRAETAMRLNHVMTLFNIVGVTLLERSRRETLQLNFNFPRLLSAGKPISWQKVKVPAPLRGIAVLVRGQPRSLLVQDQWILVISQWPGAQGNKSPQIAQGQA